MTDKITAPRLRTMRERGEKIVCVTAYDAVFAGIADEAGADLILVGDSVGNTVLGYDTTIPVSLEDMVRHTQAVRTAVKRALLVADLPFGTYQVSTESAMEAAIALAKAGAEAVKLEGDYTDEIRAIIRAGIPVMGHVGMTPQSVHRWGGHRVQGRGASGAVVEEIAKKVADAGAFGIVLELMPSDLAKKLTNELACPTIGIGAGPDCDGQIQVLFDVLGLSAQSFKHAKQFVEGRNLVGDALRAYAAEVRSSTFPTEENSF